MKKIKDFLNKPIFTIHLSEKETNTEIHQWNIKAGDFYLFVIILAEVLKLIFG